MGRTWRSRDIMVHFSPSRQTHDAAALVERFLANVARGQTCWTWLAGRDGAGYGLFHVPGLGTVQAHCLAWELAHGPMPEDVHPHHRCHHPACVRVDHLELLSPRAHTMRHDGPSARNAGKTHCDAGHEFTEENTYVRPDGGGRVCRTCNRDWVRKTEA